LSGKYHFVVEKQFWGKCTKSKPYDFFLEDLNMGADAWMMLSIPRVSMVRCLNGALHDGFAAAKRKRYPYSLLFPFFSVHF